MAKKAPGPGDLVIIRNPDVLESFLLREPELEEVIHGVLIRLDEEDPDTIDDDVWIVLVNDQLYKMLRWEFECLHAKV